MLRSLTRDDSWRDQALWIDRTREAALGGTGPTYTPAVGFPKYLAKIGGRIPGLIVALASVVVPVEGFEALPRAAPAAVAVDGAALDRAIADLGAVDGVWTVVVARDGKVVAEEYWTGLPGDRHPIWSVTKSVTSTLAGIAIDQGLLSDVETRLADHLPDDLVMTTALMQSITLRHLLMMTSGLRWSEDNDWLPWLASPNPAQFMLDRPLSTLPGTTFNYSSGSSHLPSVMLEDALGSPLETFADTELFSPLGITDWVWDSDPQGRPFGGHGIEWRTEDLAKFGVLFLERGQWGDSRIVSAAWVDEAVTGRFGWGDSYGALDNVDYGYLWWIAEAAGHPVFIAWGWGGQFAFCVPDLDLVVATSADGEVGTLQADIQERGILGIIVDRLLPAVRRYEVFADDFETGDLQFWMTGRN